MKVLVCGGRDYKDTAKLFLVLDKLHEETPISLVIQGKANGADSLAKQWAELREIDCDSYPAKWSEHGKFAGPTRNIEMLQKGKPDLVVAFPGGNGTRHMVNISKNAKVKVIEIKENTYE